MKYDYVAVRQLLDPADMVDSGKYQVSGPLFAGIEEPLKNCELVNASVVTEVDGKLYVYGLFRIPEIRRPGTK